MRLVYGYGWCVCVYYVSAALLDGKTSRDATHKTSVRDKTSRDMDRQSVIVRRRRRTILDGPPLPWTVLSGPCCPRLSVHGPSPCAPALRSPAMPMATRGYGGWAGDACGLTLKLHNGTRPAKWAKTEVTMRFLVENYP